MIWDHAEWKTHGHGACGGVDLWGLNGAGARQSGCTSVLAPTSLLLHSHPGAKWAPEGTSATPHVPLLPQATCIDVVWEIPDKPSVCDLPLVPLQSPYLVFLVALASLDVHGRALPAPLSRPSFL